MNFTDHTFAFMHFTSHIFRHTCSNVSACVIFSYLLWYIIYVCLSHQDFYKQAKHI